MKKMIALFSSLFILSGCNEEDKILKELKEMNHRQDHQYKMQLLFRKYDDTIQMAGSIKEKQDIMSWQEKERYIDILEEQEGILETLKELKELNKKNFTGNFSIGLRSYILEDSLSYISSFFKLLLRSFTSNKYDADIKRFKVLNRYISNSKLRSIELESFPCYITLEWEKHIRDCEHKVEESTEIVNEFISKEINELEKKIEHSRKRIKI